MTGIIRVSLEGGAGGRGASYRAKGGCGEGAHRGREQ